MGHPVGENRVHILYAAQDRGGNRLQPGRPLAVSDVGNALRIWDIQASRTVTTLKGHTDQITTIASSRDGKRVATSGPDFKLKLWNGGSGELLATLTPANDNTTPEFQTKRRRAQVINKGEPIPKSVISLDFSPDG